MKIHTEKLVAPVDHEAGYARDANQKRDARSKNEAAEDTGEELRVTFGQNKLLPVVYMVKLQGN